MKSANISSNVYTDAPDLHPNLFLGSIQILFWIFFHPSAWRNFVKRVEPGLYPNFCLAELKEIHWRNPMMVRLFLGGYIFLPLFASLLLGLALWFIGEPDRGAIAALLLSLGYGVAASLAVGMTIAVSTGIVYGLIIATLIFLLPDVGGVDVVAGSDAGSLIGIVYGIAAGVAGAVHLRVSSLTIGSRTPQRINGFVVSMAISGFLLFLAYQTASGELLGDQNGGRVAGQSGFISGTTFGMIGGILYGFMCGIATGYRIRNWRSGLIYGLAAAIVGGIAYGVSVALGNEDLIINIAAGVGGGLLFGGMFGLTYVLAEYIGGVWVGTISGAFFSGMTWVPLAPYVFTFHVPLFPTWLFCLVSISLGLAIFLWGPIVLFPIETVFNFLLYHVEKQQPIHSRSIFHLHSAFWDEHQRLPLFGLDDHLILVAERNPAEAQAAMEYLSTSRQRWAARSAQIELDARRLECCSDIKAISEAHKYLTTTELTGPASALLQIFKDHSHNVKAALNQSTPYLKREALRKIDKELTKLQEGLRRSDERYAVRFHPIAKQWQKLVSKQVQAMIEAVELSQEIDNPYIVGLPLSEQPNIFVGRTDAIARIEQLLLDRRHPPILLYGQRRMGKTSLLKNLGRLLPLSIVPMFLDGQRTSLAGDYTDFLFNVVDGMVESARLNRRLELPPLRPETMEVSPFTGFIGWLKQVEQLLETHQYSMALLAIDELEALDRVSNKGRFDEVDVLNLLRHLIQHHSLFKILLASSYPLQDFRRWASYLINVQVVKIDYLKQAEAIKLIEHPVPDFDLRYEPEAGARVLSLTRGHPALIQLLCREIVMLKNEQPPAVRRLARVNDVEAAVPRALTSGSYFFFVNIEDDVEKASISNGLVLLRFMAEQGEGAVVDRDDLKQFVSSSDELKYALELFLQRDLIEPVGTGHRFQVELVRRWFAQPDSNQYK